MNEVWEDYYWQKNNTSMRMSLEDPNEDGESLSEQVRRIMEEDREIFDALDE